MVEIYVILILNGKRTLDKVPLVIREQVKVALEDVGIDKTTIASL